MTVAVLPGVSSHRRAATARSYLMCEPRYFTVSYAINAWMDPSVDVDTERAMAQWVALRDIYRRLGHSVHEIEPQSGLLDMVFAANSGTVLGGRVLGARFMAEQRADEAEHYRRWFVGHGYRDVVLPREVNEGEGDFVWTGRELLAGFGFRTVRPAHREARGVFEVPVVSLRLVDPRFYHLDTALFVLTVGRDDRPPQVAYYPGAFSADSRRVLRRLFPDAVIATVADAVAFGLNAVSDDHNVVLPMEATGLADRLAGLGYAPVGVDISELRKSGGGPKCCTLELRD